MSKTTSPTGVSSSQPPQAVPRTSDALSHGRGPQLDATFTFPAPVHPTSTAQAAVTINHPPTMASHLSSESRNMRTTTSADRSTVHSSLQKGAPWPVGGGASSVKNEDDDASLSAPGLPPTSALAASIHQQPQHHFGHHQYAYMPEQFYNPQATAAPPQGPSGPLSPQTAYPTQQAPQYTFQQQSPFARNAPQQHYHYTGQQSQPQSPSSSHTPHDPRCECRDCSNGGVMGGQPFAAPGLEFAGRAANPFGWTQHNGSSMGSDPLAGGSWMETLHRQREAAINDRQGGWHEPQGMMGPSSAPLHPQHAGMSGIPAPPQSFPGERAAYPGDVSRWPNSQFDYNAHSAAMYPSSYPPSTLGPSSTSMSPTGSSVSWAVPQDPSSPDGPPSPSDSKSDKPVKHKSRKTWTEAEWKKLTDLAERSKRGDPHADIDWDYVTNGFGGRRCRQGILTVAAKRGLKVSTREARTIGKRGRSAEDPEGE